tara:strand:- start:3343 stop:5757 length:2415 start_codon:yes stop_codon:yes gene_type:complete
MAQDPSNAGGNSYTLDNVTFPVGRSKIQSIFNAIRSTNKGSSAPDLVAGQFWIDDSGGATWIMYFYDGSNNINFATIDTNNNTINFTDSAQDIITDTTPQLGGNLDVNGNSIISASNGNIAITPNGSGKVILDGLSHPTSDGSNGQFLKTDGAGNLSFGTVITDLVGDTTPQLGGDLDLNSNDITGTGNINITGAVTMSGDLTVNGTTTTINSTTLTVDDKNVVLASGAADSNAADGAGLTVDGASATLTYTHSGTKWNVNKDFDVTGNIIVSGTVDGRDLQTDGTKLDGIEASATADQTAAEIRTLVDSATDSNVFTDADHTKLNAIEASATADQTDAEIRAAVEAATDSNVFTDADHTKLNGIETSATADQTGAEIKAAYEGEADTNAFTDALLTKLNGIETSADVTDATNVDAAGAIMNSDVATKGQLIVGDGTGDPTILSVGTDGLYLKADSSAASGVAWASVAGGSSVGGSNGVDFNDDVKVRFGTGNDLEIFHESSSGHSKMKDGSGVFKILGDSVRIRSADDSKASVNFNAAGAVEIHHNNVLTAQTSANGFEIPADNLELRLGASADLTLFHDGNDSYVRDAGTGNLRLEGTDIRIANNGGTADYIRCTNGGAVDLLHNNTVMASTTSAGFRVQDDRRLEIANGSNWSGELAGKIEHHSANMYHQFTTTWIARNSAGSDVFTVDSSGNGTFNANVSAFSDLRLKEDVKTIDNALDKVSKLRGVEYTRKETKAREIGVIAQEVKEIVPELVSIENRKSDINPEGLEDLHTMKYGNTVGLLIEAIKELKSEIEELKKG